MLNNNIKSKVIGVDISSERTRYAVVDVRGNIFDSDSFNTNDYPDAHTFSAVLSEKIMQMMEKNGGIETFHGVGVSTPSGNHLTGCIENAPNLPWKGHVPMAALLRDGLGIAVTIGNDAHIAALSERVYGNGRGKRNLLCIKIGIGLGSCFFSNGGEHVGSRGFAGEFGHICYQENGRLCGCGSRGCLEAYVAHKGIIKTAEEVLAESSEPSLMRSLNELTPVTICECCNKGDKLAIEVFRRTGHALGYGLAIYATIIDPEVIVLTGGITNAGKWLLEPTNEAFEAHVFGNLKGKVKIMLSSIKDEERDVLGASALAWHEPEYSLFK